MVKYFWSESNGVDRPTVNYKEIAPEVEYYVGMPLKIVDAETVEPTDGDPDYICMATYNKENDAAVLQIAVMEVFPDAVYERWNEDGTVEDVRFGGKGGGVSSWNDLTDKPFYETVTEALLNITFDGDLTGKETVDVNGTTAVKLSDEILTVNQLIGGTVSMRYGGEDIESQLTSDNVIDGATMGVSGIILVAECVIIAYGDTSSMGVSLSTGVWFMYSDDTSYAKSLSIPMFEQTEIKKIDPKFYEQPCYDDTETFEKDVTVIDNGTFAKYATLPGFTISEGDNLVITFKDEVFEGVVANDDGILATPLFQKDGINYFVIMQDSPMLPGTHIVFYPSNITGVQHVKIEKSFTVPLPEKYIPELSQITLISPSGTKFKVTVDDTGALTAVEV